MRRYKSLRDVMHTHACSLAQILDLLTYKDSSEGYIYLTNQDCIRIITPGFFRLPRQVFEELATQVTVRAQDFGPRLLEILHTIVPTRNGDHHLYPSVESISDTTDEKIPANILQDQPFYRLSTIKPRLTKEDLMAQGYSEAAATVTAQSSTADPIWAELANMRDYAMSAQRITPDNVFVPSYGAIIQEISMNNESYDSYEMQLIQRLREELFTEDFIHNEKL